MMQMTPRSGDKKEQLPQSYSLPLDIVGGTSFGRYPKISNEQTYNMIISDGALVNFYGYTSVATIAANGTARELYSSPKFNHLIAVVDNGVYTIDTNNTVELVGNLLTSTGYVYIAENNANQIAIVDGTSNVYIYNYSSNTFQVVPLDLSPFTGATGLSYISFQDTYFIAAVANTNVWILSANNDGTTWNINAADTTGLFQTKPCSVIATVPLDRQLFVMAQTGTESWYDVGYTLFPYQRNNQYSIDYGCLNAQTIAVGYGMMVWLGSNEKSGIAIMVSTGGPPSQIQFDGIEFLFSNLTQPQNCYGFLFKLDGHVCYQFTFPAISDNKTYVYDFNTQKFFTLTDEDYNYHIAKRIAFFNNSYFFVSFKDGNLYEIDSDVTDYNGSEIPRIRITKNIRFPNADRFIIQNMNITMESGINTTPSRVDLSLSTNGGYSYGNIYSKTLNGLGRRKNIFQWWNLGGIENDLVLQFRFWSQGRFVVTDGNMSLYT